ncbi:hypothetical protein QAD02_008116 [Eretmocerus hayati]|uniref:Uncharacterized protein n=1 Tax=Eretmocerus hayati TaxID=131215 RepID=A0ACC2N7Z5_9HYME|nr:hypothetical protein QAD02_008116 [Eretmocerus hayati]
MHPSIAECIYSFQKSIEELSGVIATLKNVSSDVDNLRSRVDEIGQVASQIPAIVEDIANLKKSSTSEISEIKDRVNKLEHNAGSASQSACNVDALTLEIQDRNSRMKNLIMFNVPENQEQDSTLDLAAVKNNLKKIKHIKLDRIKVHRIGSAEGTNKPRPILAELSSRSGVMKVLGNKSYLPKPIAVSTDRTKAQREQLNSVRAEAERINGEKGSRCKTVKYVGGVPTIVDYSPPPQGWGGKGTPRSHPQGPKGARA